MSLEEFMQQWHDASPTMEVRTSGSTGKPKIISVEKQRMLASARMTCDFLELKHGDCALLCMPLDYIAGKMMVVRAIERGLNLMCVSPSGHPLCSSNRQALNLPLHPNVPSIDLAAMVPMQVCNTLQIPEERQALCKNVHHLIIGGGALSPEMEEELSSLPIQAWSSYGMTETLSHIALRHVGEPFYSPLPGITLGQDADGCLTIDAPALCPSILQTNDIVEMADATHFRILGRRDNTICSGGIKIQIEEVEVWLHSMGIDSMTVTWRPDPKLGQALVYLSTDDKDVATICRWKASGTLPISHRQDSRYWWARDIIHVDSLPLTPTGKPDRAKAHDIAVRYNKTYRSEDKDI